MNQLSNAEVQIASWHTHTFISWISVVPTQLSIYKAWRMSTKQKSLYSIWTSRNRKDLLNLWFINQLQVSAHHLTDLTVLLCCIQASVARLQRALWFKTVYNQSIYASCTPKKKWAKGLHSSHPFFTGVSFTILSVILMLADGLAKAGQSNTYILYCCLPNGVFQEQLFKFLKLLITIQLK